MNIKPTDLHLALPKIMEPTISQFNQQFNSKQNLEADQMVQNMQVETEETLHKSNAVDPAVGELIQDGQQQNQYERKKNRKNKKDDTKENAPDSNQAKHPFIGKHIDFKA